MERTNFEEFGYPSVAKITGKYDIGDFNEKTQSLVSKKTDEIDNLCNLLGNGKDDEISEQIEVLEFQIREIFLQGQYYE